MGNSESAVIASQGGAIQGRIDKEKKRAKRLGCCCCWCHVSAVVALIIGVVLLVYFAAAIGKNYAKPDTKARDEGLAFTGIAFVLLGVVLLLIGILFAVGLYFAYRRLNGKSSSSNNFVPKKYANGTAPYPQQDWGEMPDPNEPAAIPVPQQQQPGPAVSPDTITPEIR